MTRARLSIGALAFMSLSPACALDRELAPSPSGTVHPSGIADPTSPAFHGALLRSERWSGMLAPDADDACGRCHAGSPAPVAGVTSFAPGATACTTCHSEPQGALACTTCHTPGGAHTAHVEPTPSNAVGLPCSTCHPSPGMPVMGALHGDGVVEVGFDPRRVAPEASYDPTTRACAVECHDLGGARPRPSWNDTKPIVCGDCHTVPPPAHFPGSCTDCHAEPNRTGTMLVGGPLHMNGRVDLGNGSGQCGACHGDGSSAWPATGAHRAHQRSSISAPIACENCHVVPTDIDTVGHLDGVAKVSFSRLAVARGSLPAWDGQRCSNVACHGATLTDAPAVIPAWRDKSNAAATCGACHGLPPTQHTPSTSCSRSNCHGGEVVEDAAGTLSIAPGDLLHINGVIDHAQ